MKKQRILAMITALALLFSMAACFALPAVAAEEAGEKIEIETAEELIALANGDLAGNYIQMADIDLTGHTFSPIGTPTAPFTGVYDGNGYTVFGLTLDSDQAFQGLFGVNCGEIRNLTLGEDCSIKGSSYVGAVAGFNQGTIENCISRASVTYKAAEADTTAQTYRIMSQNLCQWGDNDLTAYDDYVDSTTHSRRPSMIQRIENSDPDILLFQEVSFRDYNYNGKTITNWDTFLRNTLTDYTVVGTYRSNSDKEGVTIGFRTEKFELVEEGMFWLSENPDAPRAEQKIAWDAGCVRTAEWVVLKDKTTGQQIIACSTHTDHMGVVARDKGSKLVAERMAALQEKYPDALLAVGGDFNNNPGSQGYINMENGLNGLLDDSRYVAEDLQNNIGTHGDINDLTAVRGELTTIDYIYVNSATTEVPLFYVMNDNYYDLRPSDHEGVFASIKVRENRFVGGICGANGGSLSNIIAEGTVEGGEVFGHGAVMGNALLMGLYEALFAEDASTETMAGTPISIGAVELEALPETPDQLIVDKLNQTSGVFELREGEYAILVGCGQYELAKVVFKGVPKYCFVGSTFTFEAEEGLPVYLNGEPFEGRSIIVPSGGAVISVLEPIQSVTEEQVGGDFTVKNDEDFLYLCENLPFFQFRGVTVHLLCDIDLSAEVLSGFTGFLNPSFSIEGYDHTIKNWGSKEAPGGAGFFRVTTGEGGVNFIRNLNFINCHVSGGNAAVVYSVVHANSGLSGLPINLELSGITLDQCSLFSKDQSSGMLLSRYGSKGADYTVDIFDIRITDSAIDANSKEHIGFIVGKTRTADNAVATFNVRDCYLYGNTIENAVPGVGFVAGSVEAATYADFSNIGVFRNSASGTGISYLVSDSYCAGAIKGDGLIFAENTVETDGAYMVEGVYDEAKATLSNYRNDAELTALIEGTADEYTATTPEGMASGEPGWLLNSLLEEASFWWAQDGTVYKPCQKSERLCRVTVHGESTEVSYLHVGATVELPAEGEYTILKGESTVENGVLTVLSDTVVSVTVSVSAVEGVVSGGNYTVSSLEDWMALYRNIEYFRDRDVTIHLYCDIDLSDEAAAEFTCFENSGFSFDGHGFTVKNWGSEEEPLAHRALFYVTDGNYGLNFIKNLKFSNCHLASGGGNQAILYSDSQGNSGLVGLPCTLTLENIHFEGCSVATNGQCGAILLSRYGSADGDFTVTIKNCSVKNCVLDAGGTAHKGLLVGKPRGTSYKGTYQISDCYIAGNTITNATTGAGFIFGTAESHVSDVRITNVGVLNNSLTTTDAGAYVGYSDYNADFPVALDCVLFAGNTVNAPETYLVGSTNGGASLTYENVYGDMTDLTGAVSGDPSVTFTPDGAQIASGEAAWLLNQQMEAPLFYWGAENGAPALADANHQMAKVTFLLEDRVVKTVYAPGGESIALAVDQDPDATFSLVGGSGLEGESFTVPNGSKELAVTVHTEDPSLFLSSVSDIAVAVNEGVYLIKNVEDWMYVSDHLELFNHVNVTLALGADIDLSQEAAASFAGFKNAAFSFDGQDHTVSNWTALKEGTTNYNSFFPYYMGKKISDLKLEGNEVGGNYGRSLLIGGYAGTASLEISNIHVKDCMVDATTAGNQMALFISKPTATAESGATITVRDCSVEGSSLKATCGERINNAGVIVGSAYNGFNYHLSNILIQDCRVETNTGAGAIVVGAIESTSSVVMEQIGVFNNTLQPNATNEIPAVLAGEMSGTASLTVKRSMIAGNTADERDRMAMVCHFGTSVAVAAENCLVDLEPLEVQSTNNNAGATAGTSVLAGAEQLTAAAFKSGEAAWRMNQISGDGSWTVREHGEYPAFGNKVGYAKPSRITAGEAYYYTDGSLHLSEEAVVTLNTEEGVWMSDNTVVTTSTVFASDTALTFTAHVFNDADARPYGESQHSIACANGCGKVLYADCEMGDIVPSRQAGRHGSYCVCGRAMEEDCHLVYTDRQDGTHEYGCDTCSYVARSEACCYAYSHIEGTDTHFGTCIRCESQSAPEACSHSVFKTEQAPGIGVEGSGYWLCDQGCGYHQPEAIAALGDCNGDAEISMADVVILLRVISGALSIDRIDCIAGNVYAEDGYAENGGISTADALMLLKYVMDQ